MLPTGHEVKLVDDVDQKDYEENFKNCSRLMRLTPGNWRLSTSFEPFLKKLYNFKFKPTDVIVAAYPKCGEVWALEIVWTMLNNPNLDNPMANNGITSRCPFLEFDAMARPNETNFINSDKKFRDAFNKMCPGKDPKDGICLEMADATPEPRTLKTHLPISLIHPKILDKCKVIYVARNPKDLCVSFLHSARLLKGHSLYSGTKDKFIDYFVSDAITYSPYGLHVKEAWNKRDHPNMHFVFYEDMVEDPRHAIQEINKFVGADMNEKQITDIVDYTSFSAMKARDNLYSDFDTKVMVESVLKKDGGFFRKGQVGNWKENLNEKQEKKINEWIEENVAEIPFKFE